MANSAQAKSDRLSKQTTEHWRKMQRFAKRYMTKKHIINNHWTELWALMKKNNHQAIKEKIAKWHYEELGLVHPFQAQLVDTAFGEGRVNFSGPPLGVVQPPKEVKLLANRIRNMAKILEVPVNQVAPKVNMLLAFEDGILKRTPAALEAGRAICGGQMRIRFEDQQDSLESRVDKLVEDKLIQLKRTNVKAHISIINWAIKEIGGLAETQRAIEAWKVLHGHTA